MIDEDLLKISPYLFVPSVGLRGVQLIYVEVCTYCDFSTKRHMIRDIALNYSWGYLGSVSRVCTNLVNDAAA